MGNLKDWALGLASKASKVEVRERQVGDAIILDLEGNIITGESAGIVRGVIRRLLAAGHNKIFLNMAALQASLYESAGQSVQGALCPPVS